MSTNTVINTAILSLIGLFGGGAATLFVSNFWYAVVCVVVVLGLAFAYEQLPASV